GFPCAPCPIRADLVVRLKMNVTHSGLPAPKASRGGASTRNFLGPHRPGPPTCLRCLSTLFRSAETRRPTAYRLPIRRIRRGRCRRGSSSPSPDLTFHDLTIQTVSLEPTNQTVYCRQPWRFGDHLRCCGWSGRQEAGWRLRPSSAVR